MADKEVKKSKLEADNEKGPNQTEDNSWNAHINRTLGKLQELYKKDILILEEKFQYNAFRPSWFTDTVTQKKPFVVFIGPWSAGKSTFINYLVQSNVLLTGPHPTTDKFTLLLYGEEIERIPGRVLVSDTSKSFRGLAQFGDSFVESVDAICVPHPILKSISLIDTPGVLESAGDSKKRKYDYIKVMKWFVERSDLVFLMFDPSKLDTGPELRQLFRVALQNQESKLRFILNKADTVKAQELMRIYGSLFWSLSSLITSTEPPRVYISSFWDQPYRPETNHDLFNQEKADIIYELTDVVPRQSLDKRVSSVIRRGHDVYHHALVCATLSSKLPKFFGIEKTKKNLLSSLGTIFNALANEHGIHFTDFGSIEEYTTFFSRVDMKTLPNLEKCKRKKWFETILTCVNEHLPALLNPLKEVPVEDPRNRKESLMLQRQYNESLQRQYVGIKGLQGPLGEANKGINTSYWDPKASENTFNANYINNDGVKANNNMMGMTTGFSASPFDNFNKNSNNAQMAQMMQMMQMMQMQQMQKPQEPQLSQGDQMSQIMLMMKMQQMQKPQEPQLSQGDQMSQMMLMMKMQNEPSSPVVSKLPEQILAPSSVSLENNKLNQNENEEEQTEKIVQKNIEDN